MTQNINVILSIAMLHHESIFAEQRFGFMQRYVKMRGEDIYWCGIHNLPKMIDASGDGLCFELTTFCGSSKSIALFPRKINI